jgi:transcriptional regulator with XRE-family HTH domain
MKMRVNQKLKGKIVECFGTQKAFSDACGMSLVSISKKLNGKTSLSTVEIKEWSQLLGIQAKDYVKFFFSES